MFRAAAGARGPMDLGGAEPASRLEARRGEGDLDGVVLSLLAQGEGAAGDDHGGLQRSGFHEHAGADGEWGMIPQGLRPVKGAQTGLVVMKSPYPP